VTGRRIDWLWTYYAATPLFAIADWICGANVRAAAFAEAPGMRAGYYLLCIACFGLVHARPTWGGLVAILECSLNLLLLILSLLLPYYAAMEAAFAGEAIRSPITTGLVFNFLIAGSVWVAVFYGALPGASPFSTPFRRITSE
jgi:hypothetical protein